jgi:phosphopantothenoylcysteine synthetase/decarboxylase
VLIVMKMLETQVGQLAGRPMGNKEEYPRQLQGPKTAKATQTHSGDHEITTEGPEFEMPSHYMKEVVASVKTKGQS